MYSKDRAISYWTMGQRFLRMANVTSEQLVVTFNLFNEWRIFI